MILQVDIQSHRNVTTMTFGNPPKTHTDEIIESSEVWFGCPRKKMDQNVVTWNAKCPIFLGNLTPKTSNYCLKNRSRKLIYPNLWLGETTHWSEAWILNSWDIQAGISIRDVWTTWMGGDNVKYVFFCSSFVGGNDPILITMFKWVGLTTNYFLAFHFFEPREN